MIRRSGTGEMTEEEWEHYYDPGWDCDLRPPFDNRATTLLKLADAVIDGEVTKDHGALIAATVCGTSMTGEFTKACEKLFDYPKEDDDRCDEALGIAYKYATQAKIEQLELLKSEIRQGFPIETAALLALDICGGEITPHLEARAADFLSGTKRYGNPTAEEFYRLFSPTVKKGIST